jgi:hypothetical protein
MLMARSSRRLSFSTNSSKAAWGRRIAEMPLFKSTGVGEKADSVIVDGFEPPIRTARGRF